MAEWAKPMSTIRFIAPTGPSGVTPVWIWGGSSRAARNYPGGVGDMIALGNGYLVLRNSDAYIQCRPNIYEAFGPGGILGQTKATTDTVIMPNAGTAPTTGSFPLTFGASTVGGIVFNASAATVAADLNGLASIIAAGGIGVTGANGGPYTVTFNLNGVQSAFQSGANVFGATTDNFVGVVIIKTVQAGDASTPNIQTITPAIVQGQAAALLINAGGQVDFDSVGTFVSPTAFTSKILQMTTIGGVAQYASLATSMAPAVLGGASCIFCAGIFQNYYRKGSGVAALNLAMIDMGTKTIRAGFAGGSLSFNAALGVPPALAPKVFSDGAASFGMHSPGTGWGYNGDLIGNYIWTYTYTFGSSAGAWQPSGLGVLVSINVGGGASINPIASYRGTGFNGPIVIAADGSIASSFAVARFSIATPVKSGAVFLHDSLLTRPQTDIPAGNTRNGVNQSGAVATMTFTGADAGTYNLVGGSIYGWQQGTFNGSSELASVRALFPDCTVSQTSTSVSSGTRTTVITVTLPANATYVISLATAGGGSGNMPQFLCISSSDGATNTYYPAPFQTGISTLSPITQTTIGSTALAVQGSTVCHVMHFQPTVAALPNFANANWGISIPGVGRINVSLNGAQGASTVGNAGGAVNGFSPVPVSVVPFAGGFAIALPHDPTSNSGVPYQYTFSPAKIGAVTTLLKCPIILIDAAGNPNTAFDAALYAAFFSLGRTDSARYGPLSLMVANGHLYFGSFYVPSYLLDSGGTRQIDGLGGLITAPAWSPFSAGRPFLEVLCACDTSGNRVLPADHP